MEPHRLVDLDEGRRVDRHGLGRAGVDLNVEGAVIAATEASGGSSVEVVKRTAEELSA